MSNMITELSQQDLFQRIASDVDGTLRDEALARIREKAQAVKRASDAGVPPAEFQRLSKVQAGLAAAETVVNQVWVTAKSKREKGGA